MKKMLKALLQKRRLATIIPAKGIIVFLLCMMVGALPAVVQAQNQPTKTITGNVLDAAGQPLLGVTVIVKGTTIGTITDVNGNYTLNVPSNAQTLVFSFVGMETKEIPIGSQMAINVSLAETAIGLSEVIVTGYGSQKKESIVGAIVQTTGEDLKRMGGVVNLTHALSGTLPGVTTQVNNGMPGRDDPRIIIRAVGTWNNSQPLILVDGVERKMSDIDVSEVESISVLKDASATAVFGVKGAEGVILINTKRGKVGKPEMTFDFNYTAKNLSRTPEKLDSYTSLDARNKAIEYELNSRYDTWAGYVTPPAVLNKYKLPQTGTTYGIPDKYIFPNIDWVEQMTNPYAYSWRGNFNISGGTDFAKYFGSLSYSHDGDLMQSGQENDKIYRSEMAYDRINYRTNLDFNLTKTTIFSANISGYVGKKTDGFIQEAYGTDSIIYQAWYFTAPNAMYPQFPGTTIPGQDASGNIVNYPIGNNPWGYNAVLSNIQPVYQWINNRGVETVTRTQVQTDFTLKQKLDFITQGLSVQGSFSYDTQFTTAGGISDFSSATESFFIDPAIAYKTPAEPVTKYFYGSNYNILGSRGYDYVNTPASYLSENFGIYSSGTDNWGIAYPLPFRRQFYQIQANYARVFGKHDVGALALMNRETFAESSMFPRYREDWVGRLMYNYDNRYMFETNAAYNGSEKFGKGYRFGFFPSVAAGWMISNESFLKRDWLNKLKVRYSIGKVGNDNFSSQRWAYENGWALDDRTTFGYPSMGSSYYLQYIQSVIGNPDLAWEESTKQNFGLEVGVFKNRIMFNADIFRDHRENIFMSATQRNIPTYFGGNPVAANLGETKTQGYELELRLQNTSARSLYYWMNWTYTHAEDEIVFMEDPELLPTYQKKAGFQIDQPRVTLQEGFMQTWDDVYASPRWSNNNQYKLPGEYDITDFNGDGLIDGKDSAPYAYPERPQNTYSVSFGSEYKGFSVMLQFYGVFNTTRFVRNTNPFYAATRTLLFEPYLDSWRPDYTPSATYGPTKPLRSVSATYDAQMMFYDASYLRLKTAEIAYTFRKGLVQRLKMSSARIYLNGNNLIFWSDLLDDLEATTFDSRPGYPLYKRINVGASITF